MNRLIAFLPLATALGGCIIYDTDPGKCRFCGDDDWDTGSGLGDDTASQAPEYVFTLDPDQAHAGDTFIASLTVEGDFDLATVESIEFLDGVSVSASSLRQDELLLTLVVAPDAAEGDVDMLLHLAAGGAQLVEGALTIVPAGGTGDGGDGGTGDGGTGDSGC